MIGIIPEPVIGIPGTLIGIVRNPHVPTFLERIVSFQGGYLISGGFLGSPIPGA